MREGVFGVELEGDGADSGGCWEAGQRALGQVVPAIAAFTAANPVQARRILRCGPYVLGAGVGVVMGGRVAVKTCPGFGRISIWAALGVEGCQGVGLGVCDSQGGAGVGGRRVPHACGE